MTNELDLTRLRAVAEAATPGPWELDDRDQTVRTPDRGIVHDDSCATRAEWAENTDARFIAAFDPSTVLALLSRLEQAERELVAVKSTQVQHIVERSFETARSAGLALDEAVKIVSGWLVDDPDKRAREAEQAVARVRELASNFVSLDLPDADRRGTAWEAAEGAQSFARQVLEALDGES